MGLRRFFLVGLKFDSLRLHGPRHRCLDADTITVDVDLWFSTWLRGEIYRAEGDAVSINKELLANGLAVSESY